MKDSYLPGRRLKDCQAEDAFEALTYVQNKNELLDLYQAINTYGQAHGYSLEDILCAFFLQGHHAGIQTLHQDLINWFPDSQDAIEYCEEILDL